MRVLVCGGRDYADYKRLSDVLGELYGSAPFEVLIHGAASGADRLAGEWADQHGVPELPVPAQWGRYGNRAGPIRNAHMLNAKPDLVVAFPGGRGTADMVRQARRAGVEVREIAP